MTPFINYIFVNFMQKNLTREKLDQIFKDFHDFAFDKNILRHDNRTLTLGGLQFTLENWGTGFSLFNLVYKSGDLTLVSSSALMTLYQKVDGELKVIEARCLNPGNYLWEFYLSLPTLTTKHLDFTV